jgi:hypothetical protein
MPSSQPSLAGPATWPPLSLSARATRALLFRRRAEREMRGGRAPVHSTPAPNPRVRGLTQHRARLRSDGRVRVKLKTTWRDGTSHLLFKLRGGDDVEPPGGFKAAKLERSRPVGPRAGGEGTPYYACV